MANSTALQRLDLTLRCLTPGVLTLLLAFLPVLPLGLPVEAAAVPNFTLMSVYYWTIYRPDLMPIWAVFAIGLVQDLLSGGAIGVTPLILLGTYALVLGQRNTFLGKPFAVTWWGFMMVAAIAATVSWAIGCVFTLRLAPIGPAALQGLATLVLFPLLVWFFIGTHRRVLPRV